MNIELQVFVIIVLKPERRLALFYLANDVVQNGKRKAKDLVDMFGKAFMDSMPLLR